MTLLDIINAPWAISAEMLDEIQSIYLTHMRGEKIDVAAVEARLGRPLANEPAPYELVDGVALVNMTGVLAKRANLFSQISGGTSTQLVIRDIRQAVADSSVRAITLCIDSPGGTVDGTQTLASEIKAARAAKPVVAFASGTMASAAYWAGSAAEAIYIADYTTNVGSIGTLLKRLDTSSADAAAGIKKHSIFAGKYKVAGGSDAPMTPEEHAYLQAQVDYTCTLFVDDVAAHRGVSVEKVLSDMADGRVFIGQQAIDAGLVDGVSTLDDLIAKLSGGVGVAPLRTSGAGVAHQPQSQEGANDMPSMTAEQVQAALKEHPAIADNLRAEGATAERERILGIQGLAIPGHDALIASHVADPKKSVGDAAIAITQAQKKVLEGKAAALAGDAPQPAAPSSAPAPAQEAKELTREQLHAKAVALSNEKGISYVDAVRQLEQQGA